MDDDSKNTKKSYLTEERMATLAERYSETTVLQLLQEMAISVPGKKIDWNEMVRNTSTGISNAREYQMIWRHLAYDHALTDQLDDSNPLDDDSDLEHEVEVDPDVSPEARAEAKACVNVSGPAFFLDYKNHDKSTERSVFLEHDLVDYFLRALTDNELLIASGQPIGSHVPNNLTVEAPLTITVPRLKMPSDSSLPATIEEKTIVIPVSVPKEPLSSETSDEEGPSVTSRAGVPPRRKRKVWSRADDLRLTIAVRRYGEENWATIAGGDFKNDNRTPEELSLRWANIRKRRGKMKARDRASAVLADARKAANRAINLTLGPRPSNTNAAQMSNIDTKTSQHGSQIASAPPSNPQLGTAGPPESQMLKEGPLINLTTSPTSTIKVNAVAGGDSISNPPCSQNAVHITTGASSLTSSSTVVQPDPVGVSGLSISASGMKDLLQSVQAADFHCVSPKAAVDLSFAKHGASIGDQSKPEVDKRTSASGDTLGGNTHGDQASISSSSLNQTQDLHVALPCPKADDNGEKHGDTITTGEEIHDDTNNSNIDKENA